MDGRVPLAEVRTTFERLGTECEPVTTAEIAEALGCPSRVAAERLDELVERGEVASKPVGDEGRVWWLPEGRTGDGRRQRESEQHTRDLETELDEILRRVSDAFYALDDEFRFTYVNEKAEELLQHSEAELLGENLWETFPEAAEEDAVWEAFHTARETQKATSYELYYEPLDFRVEANIYPSETGMSVYFRDVTERVERERELAESERRYRTLAEEFPNGVVTLFDDDLEYTLAAGQAFEYLPVGAEDLEGRHPRAVFGDEVGGILESAFEAALGGSSSSVEVGYAGRKWNVHAVPVTNGEGEAFTGLAMAQDITERKERETELELFRSLMDKSNDAVFVVDPETGALLDVNETACSRLGYDRSDLLELAVPDIETNLPDQEAWQSHVENVRDEQSVTFEGSHRRADGTTVPVEVNVTYVALDRAYMLAVARDITERLEYQRRLEESERRYRTLAEHFPNGAVSVYDEDLRIELTQGSVLGETLPSREQIEGRTIADVYPDHIVEELEPLLRTAIEEGEDDKAQFEFGGRVWQVWATPLRDAADEIFAGLSFAQDITEQVDREQQLEEAVERLEESNERLESFASLLAHELRNPVTIGQIYSQQLPDGTGDEAVKYVTEAFDRIENMIDVMLVLTRGRDAVGERSSVDLETAAREAWDTVETPEATLEVRTDGVIEADETYVRHLFTNLFENAVEHGGADVTVTVGDLADGPANEGSTNEFVGVSAGRTEDEARQGAKRTDGGFYVADDGCGISPDDRDAVFEVGYTTTAEHGGTGLGLPFIKELAEVYEWSYRVTESEAGGARFEFTNVDENA